MTLVTKEMRTVNIEYVHRDRSSLDNKVEFDKEKENIAEIERKDNM